MSIEETGEPTESPRYVVITPRDVTPPPIQLYVLD